MLFALPFAAGGTLMLYLVFASMVNAIRMGSWPTVPGQIVSAELSGGGSKAAKVIANYTYTVNGQAHQGTRVSPYNADNLGSFHKDVFERLNGHRERGEPFPVHVNPEDPDDAILITEIRWGTLAMQLCFGLLFGIVGWGMLLTGFFGRRAAKVAAKLAAEFPGQPWFHRPDWRAGRIKSGQTALVVALFAAALILMLFSVPLVSMVLPQALRDGKYIALILLILPATALGLGWWAAVSFARWRRFGRTIFEIQTVPACLGGALRGKILAPGGLTASQATVSLQCDRTFRHRNPDGKYSSKTSKMWSRDHTIPVLQGQTATGEAVINVDIPVPDDLPGTGSSENSHETIRWTLYAKAEQPGADFAADFEVPVFGRN